MYVLIKDIFVCSKWREDNVVGYSVLERSEENRNLQEDVLLFKG